MHRIEEAPEVAGRGSWRRGSAWLFGGNERARSILVITVVVVLANALYVLHVFDPNPLNQVSGLGSVVRAGLLPGQNNIDPNIGFTAQALGHRAAVDWLHGHVPWWNPYEGVGAPLAGEMQAAAFFPLSAFTLLPDGQVFFRICLELLAGVATYLLLRRFTRSNLAAVVGGIGFALNGTFAWLFHAPGNPVAFLPLALLGVEWAREGAVHHRRSGWALVALSLALSLYAGFPETAFIDGLLVALWLVVRSFGLDRRALVTFAEAIAIGVGISLLLAAPILVAFVGYLPHADVGGHSGAFAHASLSATTALPTQIMPYVFGPIFGFSGTDPADLVNFWGSIGGYLGVSLCTLALVGLAGRRSRALRLVLAAWVVVGLARLVGVAWALDLVNAIPGVKATAFYRYAAPSWEFAVVVLAALGLDDLLRRSVSRVVVVASGAVMAGLCLLGWHAAHSVFTALVGAPHNHAWAVASLAWALLTIGAIVICGVLPGDWLGRRAPGTWRGVALGAIVVTDVVAMFVTPQLSAPRTATVDSGPVDYLVRHLGTQRFYTLGPIAPDYGSYFGLASVAVNDVPVPKSYAQFVRRALDTNTDPLVFNGTARADSSGPTAAQELTDHLRAYESLGVKYVVLPAGAPVPVVNGRPLPVVFSDRTASIVELPSPAGLFAAPRGACTVTPQSVTSVVVDCARPSRIVYREQFMPGSSATANGHPTSVQSHGPLFQSVTVPAGRTTLAFGYAPPGATLALVAFLVGCALLVLGCLPRARRARAARRQRSGSEVAEDGRLPVTGSRTDSPRRDGADPDGPDGSVGPC